MPIISKEDEVQINLASVYHILLEEKDRIKTELTAFRMDFNNACNSHINNGFCYDDDWLVSKNNHHKKFIEYDIYCQITEIVNDYKDLHGKFPDYEEMYYTLHQIMIQFAGNEKYELAAILKPWVDNIHKAIRHK